MLTESSFGGRARKPRNACDIADAVGLGKTLAEYRTYLEQAYWDVIVRPAA